MFALMGSQGITPLTDVLFAFTVSCLLLFVAKSFRQWARPRAKSPPGPKGYPLIGNILDLGRNPHLALSEMSEKYGEVMEISLGTRRVLVLSGLVTIQQALIKQGDDFVGRPDLYSFQFISNGQSLTFGRSSVEVWRSRRKLAQNSLRAFSTSTSPTSTKCLIEDSTSKEADYLIMKFQSLMKEKEKFEPYPYLVISVANVICAMCFGRRYDHDDQELLSLVNLNNEFGDAAASGNPADFIPILKYLPNRTMRAFKDINRRFDALIQKIIEEHYVNFDKSNIKDITDSLIDHCQMKNLDLNANVLNADDKIMNIVSDLFGAGFDTVTTALSWSLMFLVTYPEIQKKIQQEIDQVIGRERKPKLSDRSVLPYTEAFILEVFRYSSFVPFTIPHCTTRDTVLNGYYIPRDTCVFVNQWQCNHDPKIWDEPSAFKPERFIAADGSGVNRAEGEKVLLFGLGKRRCIGENIGKGETFLFLTTLLQKLEFSVCHEEMLDLTPQYGLTMKPKRCENFQVKPRF